MPREVDHDADGPAVVTADDVHPEKGDVALCRCGLSADVPFCDGSHRVTRDEDADTVYRYSDGPDGERRALECVRTAPAATALSTPEAGDEGGARLVRHEARSPLKLDAADIENAGGRIEVCRCGLTDEAPFCDDSHAACAGELTGLRYRYDDDGERRVVTGLEFADTGEE